MASTYVNDLRLNEMATGDASGSWGTVTNTNLELIGEAFSYGTETIGDADSTLTIADGAADAARSFYLKITSSVDLTTTRIVTLGPNTVSKVWMIENATTGSQVITIKQGSGATINVPNGQVKMISTDGAGSGGAVLDLLVDVDLTGTTTLVNLDVSGAVDIAGDLTLSAGGDGALRFTAASSVKVLDNNAAALVFEEADNAYMTFVTTDGSEAVKFDKALDINAATQIDATVTVGVDDTGYDVKFFGDTASAYMLWDASADDLILGGAAGLSVNSTALVTGVLTTTAATVFNGGFTANADSTLGTDKKVQFRDAAIYINSSVDGQLDIVADTEIQIAATTVDVNGALDVSGTALVTGVLTTTAATVHTGGITMPDNAKAIFGAGSDLQIYHDGSASDIKETGTGNLRIWGDDIQFFNSAGSKYHAQMITDGAVTLYYNGAEKLSTTATGIDVTGTVTATGTSVFASLDISGDIDVDGTTNLDVVDIDGATQIDATVTVGVDDTGYDVKFFGATAGAYMLWDESADDLILGGAAGLSVNSTALVTGVLTANGGAVFNESGADVDFRVESDTNANALFVQGSDGKVGIGASPIANLSVLGGTSNASDLATAYSLAAFNITPKSTSGYSLQFGSGPSDRPYIQMSAGGTSANSLLLNPYGGEVRINNTADATFAAQLNTQFTSAKNCGLYLKVTDTSGGQSMIIFGNTTNDAVGSISTSGSATAYNTSSDYRLKTDAQPMVGASARVQALKPVNFAWIVDGSRVDGFLAHEAQEIVPEAVVGTKDAMRDQEYEVTAAVEATYDEDGNELTAAVEAVMGTRSVPDYQGIDQSKLVPLLTAALQEALNKIDAMEIRLSALEG
jgi:hypothetical protein